MDIDFIKFNSCKSFKVLAVMNLKTSRPEETPHHDEEQTSLLKLHLLTFSLNKGAEVATLTLNSPDECNPTEQRGGVC